MFSKTEKLKKIECSQGRLPRTTPNLENGRFSGKNGFRSSVGPFGGTRRRGEQPRKKAASRRNAAQLKTDQKSFAWDWSLSESIATNRASGRCRFHPVDFPWAGSRKISRNVCKKNESQTVLSLRPMIRFDCRLHHGDEGYDHNALWFFSSASSVTSWSLAWNRSAS